MNDYHVSYNLNIVPFDTDGELLPDQLALIMLRRASDRTWLCDVFHRRDLSEDEVANRVLPWAMERFATAMVHGPDGVGMQKRHSDGGWQLYLTDATVPDHVPEHWT